MKEFTLGLLLMRREIDYVDAQQVFWRKIASKYLAKRYNAALEKVPEPYQRHISAIPSDLLWLVRISAMIFDGFKHNRPILTALKSHDETENLTLAQALNKDFTARNQKDRNAIETTHDQRKRIEEKSLKFEHACNNREQLSQTFLEIYSNWQVHETEPPKDGYIWGITRNRPISLAVQDSVLTVKGDAARRLFDISTESITWAVIDSGIDSTHPAFLKTTKAYEERIRKQLEKDKRRKSKESDGRADKIKLEHLKESRVVSTLDFTSLRTFLDVDIDADDGIHEDLFQEDEYEEDIKSGYEADYQDEQKKKKENQSKNQAYKKFYENIARNLSGKKQLDIPLTGRDRSAARRYIRAVSYTHLTLPTIYSV